MRVRFDSRWCVPEPELALVISDKASLVGFTSVTTCRPATSRGKTPSICRRPNSTASRGAGAVHLDPRRAPLDRAKTKVSLSVKRKGNDVFRGSTDLGRWSARSTT